MSGTRWTLLWRTFEVARPAQRSPLSPILVCSCFRSSKMLIPISSAPRSLLSGARVCGQRPSGAPPIPVRSPLSAKPLPPYNLIWLRSNPIVNHWMIGGGTAFVWTVLIRNRCIYARFVLATTPPCRAATSGSGGASKRCNSKSRADSAWPCPIGPHALKGAAARCKPSARRLGTPARYERDVCRH